MPRTILSTRSMSKLTIQRPDGIFAMKKPEKSVEVSLSFDSLTLISVSPDLFPIVGIAIVEPGEQDPFTDAIDVTRGGIRVDVWHGFRSIGYAQLFVGFWCHSPKNETLHKESNFSSQLATGIRTLRICINTSTHVFFDTVSNTSGERCRGLVRSLENSMSLFSSGVLGDRAVSRI